MAETNFSSTKPTYKYGNNKGPFKYPLENQDQYKSKIVFQAIQVIPPEFSLDTRFSLNDIYNFAKDKISNATNIFERGDEEDEQAKGKDEEKIKASRASLSPMKFKLVEGAKVDLYMPLSFQINDRFQYETPNLNLAGAATLGTLNSGASVTGSIARGIEEGFSSIADLFGQATSGDVARVITARAAQGVLGKALPESMQAAISLAAQVTVNPNTRAAFRSVGLREFTFQFKFIPKSYIEQEEVKKIIKFFRFHAYPDTITLGQVPVGYQFPDLFKIKLMYEKRKTNEEGMFIGKDRQFRPIQNQIRMCYLRSITTNYNPTATIYHRDGSPVEIDLSLNFTEYRTMSRKDLPYDELEFDPDLSAVGGGYSEERDDMWT